MTRFLTQLLQASIPITIADGEEDADIRFPRSEGLFSPFAGQRSEVKGEVRGRSKDVGNL